MHDTEHLRQRIEEATWAAKAARAAAFREYGPTAIAALVAIGLVILVGIAFWEPF